MKWVKLISPADIFTLANGLIGFLAITYIVDRKFLIASFLLLIAILMDGFDGYVARKFGSKHSMGRYLDSISDTISFCFAPAILLYATYYEGPVTAFEDFQNALTVFASMLVLCFGILRLARFSREGYKIAHFSGLPTPANTFMLVILCLLFGSEEGYDFVVRKEPYLVLSIAIIAAFLMISDIPYPKLRGKLSIIGGVAIILGLVSTAITMLFFNYADFLVLVSQCLAFVGLFSISIYLVAGPFFARRDEYRQG